MDILIVNACCPAEIARLRSRWVMNEASNIVYATDMTRREALIYAWRTWRLLDALSDGVVKFTFIKDDGTRREAIGTLCAALDENLAESRCSRKETANSRRPREERCCHCYWDVEKKGYRTFKSYHLLPDMQTESWGQVHDSLTCQQNHATCPLDSFNSSII